MALLGPSLSIGKGEVGTGVEQQRTCPPKGAEIR